MKLTKNNIEIEITDEDYEEITRQRNSKDWMPKDGDEYWFVNSLGEKEQSTWVKRQADSHRLYTSNCFKTEAECDTYLEYLNALKAINKFKLENGLNWKPNWVNHEDKYCIKVNMEKVDWYVWVNENHFNSLGYYKSQEDAQKVIDNCKKEIEIIAKY